MEVTRRGNTEKGERPDHYSYEIRQATNNDYETMIDRTAYSLSDPRAFDERRDNVNNYQLKWEAFFFHETIFTSFVLKLKYQPLGPSPGL